MRSHLGDVTVIGDVWESPGKCRVVKVFSYAGGMRAMNGMFLQLFFVFFVFVFLFSVFPATIQLYLAGLPSMCWGT